jgi:hypothetical protein
MHLSNRMFLKSQPRLKMLKPNVRYELLIGEQQHYVNPTRGTVLRAGRSPTSPLQPLIGLA